MSSARKRPLARLLPAIAVTMLAWSAYAQAPRPAEPRQQQPATEAGDAGRPARPSPAPRLPADATSEHSVDLPGRVLRFKATAGTIPIYDGNDHSLQAEIAYIAFTRTDADGALRPVTFVFNGGPGAASAYLNLGAMGPWRLPMEQIAPSSPPVVMPNAETWLDFTDLVFVDPPGAGYSRLAGSGEALRRQFWSVEGDAETLALFVRKWIEKFGRQISPKFLVGESYGGFRVPRLARILQDQQQAGPAGLVMISPVLDFGWRGHSRHAPLAWVSRLPSMAAAAREIKGAQFDREALRDVERYAAGEYLQDLMRGERDAAARERMSERVAAFTGLDLETVRRLGGRVDADTFERALLRNRGLVSSSYDATVTSHDPNPYAATSRYRDPVLQAMSAPLAAAMTEVYRTKLGWKIEDPYRLLNSEVSNNWNWGRGRVSPQAVDDLRSVVSLDPRLRVLVTHGASDLVTPYFENQLILEQLPAFGPPDCIKFELYGGGHMYYSRDASRRKLRDDAQALYRAVLTEAPKARE